MKIKKISLIALGVLSTTSILTLSSCSFNKSKDNTVTVIDMAGDKVTVPKNPKRVSCSSRNAYDLLIAYGLGENIVSMHRVINENDWIKEIYPNASNFLLVNHKEQAETYYKQNIDLVLAGDASIARELRNKGINAITIKFYGKDRYDSLLLKYSELITEIWKKDEVIQKANRWQSDLTNIINEIKSKIPTGNKKKLYYVRSDGKNRGLNATLTSPYFIEYAYRIMGVDYFNSSINNGNEKPTDEAIIKFNPDIFSFGGVYQNKNIQIAKTNAIYKDISAVKNNKLISTPVGFSPFEQVGFMLPVFFADQANKLYPNIFSYDIDDAIKRNLKFYMSYDITSEKLGYMKQSLNPEGKEFS